MRRRIGEGGHLAKKAPEHNCGSLFQSLCALVVLCVTFGCGVDGVGDSGGGVVMVAVWF